MRGQNATGFIRNRIVLLLVSILLLTGCSSVNLDRKVVFTTGFSNDEVFRIEDSTCSLTEIMVYLVNTQKSYETSLGTDIWEKETDTGTVKSRLKESVLAKVAQAIRDVPTVPCTRCKYCMSECPQHIEIPNLLGVYNEYRIFANMAGALRRYRLSSRDGAPASACIACRSCENICPQHIEISRCMAEMAEIFEDPQITGGSK